MAWDGADSFPGPRLRARGGRRRLPFAAPDSVDPSDGLLRLSRQHLADRTGGIAGRARADYRTGFRAYAGCTAADSATRGLESGHAQVPRCHVAGTASHGP